MGRLSLKVFGTPQAYHHGAPVKFATRKAQALLIYLAMEGGLHGREKLTALFWPESDAALGRAALRNTLGYLRIALAEQKGSHAQSPHLLVRRETLGLDPAALDFDRDALEQAGQRLRAWRGSPGAPLPDAGALEAALALCRGDFLEGFSLPDAPAFDEWSALQRERWRRRIAALFAELVELQEQAGALERAAETAARWVAHEPLDEEPCRRLMQLYHAAGNRGAALQVYESCRALLRKELGVEPAPELLALAERIRSAPALAPARPPAPTAAPRLEEAPLIGRAEEHGVLVELFRAAERGALALAVLEGEAGIGKTRLAGEFLRWSVGQGADLLAGQAFEVGGGLPYGPLVDCLRRRVELENAPDDLLSDLWLAELSRLLPELRERYPDLPPPSSAEALAQARLFEAVARLLLALAERRPVVLFIDDLQWADAASLALLHYVARRCQESRLPVLLVLAARSEALVATSGQPSSLADWLAQLSRDLPARRLTLAALQLEDTLRLIGELAGGAAASEPLAAAGAVFGRAIFAETAGHPLFLMETLKVLLERGLLRGHHDSSGRWRLDFSAAAETPQLAGLIPPGVRDVILARLAPLSQGAFELLAAAAVLGQRFSFEQLVHVAGADELSSLAALDSLLAPRLLYELGAAHHGSRYSFGHDKIRDVVYTEAGHARRRLFHRRAFELLAATALPGELAHHAQAAGLLPQAFELSLAAGEAALALFAVQDAIVHFERARQLALGGLTPDELASLVSAQPTGAPAPLHRLYARLGRAYELINEWRTAQAVYNEMLEMAERLGDPAMECAVLNALVQLMPGLGTFEYDPMALLQRAAAVAERSGDRRGLAETEVAWAQLFFYLREAQAALQHGERALAIARELGSQELEARCLSSLAYAKTGLYAWEEVELLAVQSGQLYAALGDRALEADSLAMVANARIHCGVAEAGIDAARRSLHVCRELANAWGQANSLVFLATALLDLGAHEEALALAQEAVGLAQEQQMPPLLIFSLAALGAVQRARGELEAARAAHLQAEVISDKLAIGWFVELVAAHLCADYGAAGDWVAACRHAQCALAAQKGSAPFVGLFAWQLTEALAMAGDLAAAEAQHQRFGAAIGANRRYRIAYLRSQAVLARAQGAPERAQAALREAQALADELSLVGESRSIQAALAQV